MKAGELHQLIVSQGDSPLGREAIERTLRPVLTSPYPFYRDVALLAIGAATLSVPDLPWVFARLEEILRTAIDVEGVRFTFDLPAVLSTEAAERGVPADVLVEYLQRGEAANDAWGTRSRVAAARSLAALAQRNEAMAAAQLRLAETQQDAFSGFASINLLALASRWMELGEASQAKRLAGLALARAQNIDAHQLRQERTDLATAYLDWLKAPAPSVAEALGESVRMGDRIRRRVYLDLASARRWAEPGAVEALTPLVLADAAGLDALLARWVRRWLPSLDTKTLTDACRVCQELLMTGRPWELGG
jgi:hypothetical protein